MAELSRTKYPNIIRTVSGAATLYKDDVVVLCDTSAAPVSMTLLEIPNGYWSTQWKLHIIDNANNASANNVTINAGVGQTINGQASVTISTNGGSVILRILSDSQYAASSSNGGAGGYTTVQDEGIALPQRSTMDFVGAYVTASDNGAKTVVTINPQVINITNAALLIAIGNSTLQEGVFYRVTDPFYAKNVVVMATSSNTVSVEGTADKYVADYQAVGDYSGVAGFTNQLGRYWDTVAPVAGDVVIYDNMHYVSSTGVNTGVPPPLDPPNWTLLNYSLTRGYIIEQMDVLYDPQTNIPFVMQDRRYNEVHFANPKGEVTFANFPFGDDLVFRNTIKGSETLIEDMCNIHIVQIAENTIVNGELKCVNISNPNKLLWDIKSNEITGGAQIGIYGGYNATASFLNNKMNGGLLTFRNILNTFTGEINCTYNVINGGQITLGVVTDIDGTFDINVQGNQIQNPLGAINIDQADADFDALDIKGNVISGASVWTINVMRGEANLIDCIAEVDIPILIANFTDNDEQGGVGSILTQTNSTWRLKLDMNNAGVYNGGTLTLNLGALQHVGEYLITGTAVGSIAKITGGYTASADRQFTLIPVDVGGAPMVIVPTLIGVAAANDIIENGSLTSVVSFQAYGTYSDRVTFHRGGGAGGYNFIKAIQSAV